MKHCLQHTVCRYTDIPLLLGESKYGKSKVETPHNFEMYNSVPQITPCFLTRSRLMNLAHSKNCNVIVLTALSTSRVFEKIPPPRLL